MPPFPALCGLEAGDGDDAPSPTRGKAPPGAFCRRGGGERSPAPPPACGGTARRPARGRQPARASGFCVLRKIAAFPPSPVLSPAQICRVASFLPGVGGENAHLGLYVSRQKAAFPPAAAGRLKSQLPVRPVFPFFGGSAPRVKSKIIVYSPVSPFKTGTKYVK